MKTKALTISVCAALGFCGHALADVSMYGQFDLSLDRVDSGLNQSTQLASNSSHIGLRGTEPLGGGWRGVFQMEAEFDAAAGGGALGSRNTYLGLAGGFGELRFGRHDTPYKMAAQRLNFFADTLGDMHNIMGSSGVLFSQSASISAQDRAQVPFGATDQFYGRLDNTIVYLSPSFEGLTVMGSYTTDYFDDRPVALSAGDNNAYSIAAAYDYGRFFFSAAYERYNNIEVRFGAEDADTQRVNPSAWKLGGAYHMDDLIMAAAFERLDIPAASIGGRDAWHFGARYGIGQAYVMGSVTHAGDNDQRFTGAEAWALGGGWDFSPRTGVYAVYTQLDADEQAFYGLFGTGKGKGVAPTVTDGDATSVVRGQRASGFQFGIWHHF